MNERIRGALGSIRAEEQLKRSTAAYLRQIANEGQERAMPRHGRPMLRRLAVAMASFAAVIFLGVASFGMYFKESAYLDIDVNPSVELTLNRFDRVIGVHAYNEDGQRVLDSVDVRHRSYEDALSALVGKMAEMGYIEDSGLLTATLQVKEGAVGEDRIDALRLCLAAILQTEGRALEEDVFAVDSDTKTHSHEQNLTPAKYLAILKLQELDPSVTFANCRDHSLAEIGQQIHAHLNVGDNGAQNAGGHGADEPSGANMEAHGEVDQLKAAASGNSTGVTEHHDELEGPQAPSTGASQGQAEGHDAAQSAAHGGGHGAA
jgi:hypothetical protein